MSDTSIAEMHFGFIEMLVRHPRRVNLDLRSNDFKRFFSENKDDVLNTSRSYPRATLGETGVEIVSRFEFRPPNNAEVQLSTHDLVPGDSTHHRAGDYNLDRVDDHTDALSFRSRDLMENHSHPSELQVSSL